MGGVYHYWTSTKLDSYLVTLCNKSDMYYSLILLICHVKQKELSPIYTMSTLCRRSTPNNICSTPHRMQIQSCAPKHRQNWISIPSLYATNLICWSCWYATWNKKNYPQYTQRVLCAEDQRQTIYVRPHIECRSKVVHLTITSLLVLAGFNPHCPLQNASKIISLNPAH
jgi:hypothetical protein